MTSIPARCRLYAREGPARVLRLRDRSHCRGLCAHLPPFPARCTSRWCARCVRMGRYAICRPHGAFLAAPDANCADNVAFLGPAPSKSSTPALKYPVPARRLHTNVHTCCMDSPATALAGAVRTARSARPPMTPRAPRAVPSPRNLAWRTPNGCGHVRAICASLHVRLQPVLLRTALTKSTC